MVKINLKNTTIEDKLATWQQKINDINKMINEKTGEGNEFLGWTTWPSNYFNSKEYKRIKISVKRLHKKKIDTLVVIGIGGSYLGAKAGIDFINGVFPHNKNKIIFAGINLSPFYLQQLINELKNKKWAICVISKSGTTLEPALAFRILRNELKKLHSKNLNEYIVCITDKSKGTLKKIADEQNYESFIIPDNIGGRYSVLTPVGLYPLMFANIDIDKVMIGAKKAENELKINDLNKNSAYKYALARFILSKKYKTEMMVSYEPNMTYFVEWWKQLFGESEGKKGKALLPTSATLTADLHSLGQYIQEGQKILFETVLWVKKPSIDIKVTKTDILDDLDYVCEKNISWINEQAYKGVLDAHFKQGKIENIVLEIEKLNVESLGYMFYFFMKACAMSAYLLNVNPFNQPGVEAYKKAMFKLLGK